MAELQLIVDDVVLKRFPLNKETIFIGRSPNNDIVIDGDSSSSVHARIDLIPSELLEGFTDIFIEDLNSTNGTFVNEKQIKRKQILNFDYIRISYTTFKLISDKTATLARTSVILPE